MPIDTVCPQCNTQLTVSDDMVEQDVRCPRCDRIFAVESTQPLLLESAGVADTCSEKGVTHGDERADGESSGDRQEKSIETPPSWLLRTPEGNQYGPVDQATLDHWVSQGRVADDCRLREVNSDTWEPAGKLYPMLIDEGNPFVTQSGINTTGNLEPHRGRVVLSIALAGCVIPFVSVLAAIMGTSDLRRMELRKMARKGESLTRAGQVIGTVASMVWIATFAIGLLVLLLRAMRPL